ncbi:MAG: tyrosine-type recombinase/integrase [Bacteroidota bacterium]
MKIIISKIAVGDQEKIAVRNEGFDGTFPAKMKQITGARWSPGQRCWHIPYTPETWEQFKGVFPDYEVDPESLRQAGSVPVAVKEEMPQTAPAPRPESRPLNPDPALLRPDAAIGISLLPGNAQHLALHLPPDLVPQHLHSVKNIHGRRWNAEQEVWEIPYTRLTLRFLSKHFPSDLLKWGFTPADDLPERLPEPERNQSKPDLVIPAKYEAAVVALEQVLMLKRYSWRTVKAYKNCFRQFIRHYDDIRPREITRKQINDYLTVLIRERNISVSHQSQILSAIKMFYIAVADQEDKVKDLFQPKKQQKLPNVLLESEVAALLRSVDNPKHRCILMLVYSAGLRLGEVIGLRLTDLQPERNRLFVRGGKGKKDRCTLLSEKVWEKLKDYMETCVDLRYIQELLGHESSKTTEIYTHITHKGWDKIKSPIDDLNI